MAPLNKQPERCVGAGIANKLSLAELEVARIGKNQPTHVGVCLCVIFFTLQNVFTHSCLLHPQSTL